VTVQNKKCLKGSQIGQIEKNVVLLEECEKRKAILKALRHVKCSDFEPINNEKFSISLIFIFK
jgi:hypothetical protein